MTEAEWLASSNPDEMIVAMAPERLSDRKLRLFLVGCCRRRWELFADGRLTSLLDVADQFAEGKVSLIELEGASVSAFREMQRAREEISELQQYRTGEIAGESARAMWITCFPDTDNLRQFGAPIPGCLAGSAAANLARAHAWSRDDIRADLAATQRTINAEVAAQAALLRCVAGNPFRPVTIEPNWRTSTIVGLASGIYQDRAFDRLLILADALEDAGCDSADILSHCRSDGPHARGCWVVDAVLGKS